MTACSNHPGTIRGAELQKLVTSSEKLQAKFRERISIAASRHGVDYDAFLLLDRLTNNTGRSEERGLGLLRSAGLVTGDAPNTMVTTEGIKAYADINKSRYDWLDEAAKGMNVEAIRDAESLIAGIKV